MHLKQIKLFCFKNYQDSTFEFHPKINGIIGLNGSGKTTILDAVHYLCLCKSFFNPTDMQTVKHDEKSFAVFGDFEKENREFKIGCTYKLEGRKSIKLNQKEYEKMADHIGLFPLVIVSPADTNLISEGSEMRRKFMDSIISQQDKSYLYKLMTYQKLLQQRNALLKQFSETGTFNADILTIYDEQLTEPCQTIFETRQSFIETLTPIFQAYYRELSSGKESVHLEYRSQLHDHTHNFKTELAKHWNTDQKSGYTTIGIHKDDLIFNLENYPVKRFGSQGQQKTFVLSLKLAQFDYIKQQKGIKSLLLLDDIFDKLDNLRFLQLLKMVGDERFGQIFITDTDQNRIETLFKEVGLEFKMISLS